MIVADTAKCRLLGFALNGLSLGAGASGLAGRRSFEDKVDNRWRQAARDMPFGPYGLSAYSSVWGVVDSGNNRVLLWEISR